MPVCLRSQPSCHASLKFAGYSNLLNGDILKMSNLKLSQPGVDTKSFHPWIAVADNILRKVGGVNVFQSNLSVAPSRLNSFKRIPVFYKELIDV